MSRGINGQSSGLRLVGGACAWALGGALALAPSPLRAAGVEPIDFDDASQIANEVDGDLGKIRRDLDTMAREFETGPSGEVGRVERRLREGEVHFLLNDFLRASIVLLDVVDDPRNQNHPRYDDCLFLLAESLRKSKNYSGARQYYESLLPRSRGERLKDVVLGLLEISSATDNYEQVERYIGRLRDAGSLSRPDVDYIYGKMLFKGATGDPARVQRAYEIFRAIPQGSSVSAQAAYYAGVALVKLGRYQDAIQQFQEAYARAKQLKDGQSLRELSALSLGRLYQEVGEVSKAADSYQEISQSSPYFGDMLYEVAWAHVRSANLATDAAEKQQGFVRGLRATELLMATAPNSRLYPQARILEGNLQIRLGAPETAYDTFQAIIDRYGTARDKLDELLRANSEPKQFFDQLVAADLGEIGATTILPPVALTWALEEEQLDRAVGMNQDLNQSGKSLEESKELVRTLSEALDGEQRFQLVPGMAVVRARALSVENRLLNLNRRLLNLERRLVWKHIRPQDQAALDAIHLRTAQLETEIQALPQNEAEVERSKVAIRGEYQAVGRRAYKQGYRVSQLRGQVVAVELWINQNRDKLTKDELALLEERIHTARDEITALEKELETVSSEIRTAEVVVSGDGGRGRARKLRAQYAALVAQELELLRSLRGQVPGQLAGLTARFDQERNSIDQMDAELEKLQSGLEQQVQKRVEEVRLAIATENERLTTYSSEHGELATNTGQMLGPVAARTLTEVGKQFKALVLQADVGIIDVAWVRKQAETRKVNDLIKEQQDRTLELETEFADVLEE